MRRGLSVAAVVLLALLARSAPARAAVGDVVPTFTGFGGSLEIGGLHERFLQEAGQNEHTVSDTFLTERLTLSTAGWVYHPRLLVFAAKVGGGLAHEDVQNNYGTGASDGLRTAVLGEYDLRTILLPEHPYNLELYTQRNNPYQRGRVFYGSSTLSTASGAIFRLKLRPYVANLSWRSATTSSGSATKDTDTVSANAVYYRDWGSLAGTYSHGVADSSFNGAVAHFTTDDYSVGNQLRFLGARITLDSTLGWNNVDQRGTLDTMSDRRFSWNERLSLALPLNFDVGVSASRYEDTLTRGQQAAGTAVTSSSRSDTLGVSVRQKLYQSLTTTYDFTLLSLDSTTGGSTGTTHAFGSSYLKHIPWGLLSAGVTAASAVVDRSGAPSVINETHGARLFDEFTLAQADADLGSIAVTVRSATTGATVGLTRDLHYSVGTTGATVQVRLLALPASVLSADPFYSYSVSVSYALTRAPETIDTTSYGGSLRLELFDHLVSPYAAYSFSRESGSTRSPAGGALDTTGTTLGLTLQKLPYTLALEYFHLQSDLNPLTRMKAEFSFRYDIGANSQALGQLRYTATDYQQGAFADQAHTEDSLSASLRVQQRFPRQHLALLLGGTYDTTSGEYRRDSYSLDGELTWVLRQLEVTASASFATSRLEAAARQQRSEHQLYYLKVTRKLF
jgi:hypothetical protein